ncbi:hypothetical protein [Candidatus Mycoplasma haematohominis]|uniref:hypothetical protein n=1 Tax=Candidatus Mycoplasma haematohominis TaxID=1494318 RepID=UPI001C0A6EE9|nr:hypothetical protein [Candidatus Mycoplasma haemohominis]
MASPLVVGAGVVGGTAAVGATSVAAYHAFNKDATPEQVKNPTPKGEQVLESGQDKSGQLTDNTNLPAAQVTTEGEEPNKEKSGTPDSEKVSVGSPSTESSPAPVSQPIPGESETLPSGTANVETSAPKLTDSSPQAS